MALISHDMGVIAGNADQVQVMRHGEIVESGDGRRHFLRPAQRLYQDAAGCDAAPRRRAGGTGHGARRQALLEVDEVKVTFPISGTDCLLAARIAARRGWRFVSQLRAGRDLGRGGRKRLREVHSGARGAAASPRRQRQGGVAGPRSHARSAGRDPQRAQGIPDRLPGPAGEPRSAHADRRFHRRAAARLGAWTVARRYPRPRRAR